MKNIVYTYNGAAYLNLTNKCCCACTFCIRTTRNGVGNADSLWLEHEPEMSEIYAALDEYDWTDIREAVFCGYGEPTCELEKLLKTAAYLREKHPDIKLRLNTNGLGDLINGRPTAKLLAEAVDIISISLNAPTAAKYMEVTNPEFGEGSFEAMLAFGADCAKYAKSAMFTVVDTISAEDIEASKKAAASVGLPLRVRVYTP